MTSIADIRTGFSHKELHLLGTVNAHPTNASVRCCQTALNTCAATLPSTLAGGIYGHSFLTMKPSLFHTLSGLRIPNALNRRPPDPPPPMISAARKVAAEDVTEIMLLSKEKKWKPRTNEYVIYHNTMAALTAIITDSSPENFYKVLHHPDLGYANRTPQEFVVHFWNTYARDKDLDMSANLGQMMVQWQPPTMPKALFTQLDVGQKFAAHHDAISDKTILRMAIENIRKYGILDIALRNWALQTTQSYWAEFTLFVYKAEKYRRDTAETTGYAGFSANFHGIT